MDRLISEQIVCKAHLPRVMALPFPEQNLAAYIHEIDAGRPWQLADYKGPDLSSIDYSKILDIFKEKND